MDNISSIKNGCTGCGVCYNVCPHKAITMKQNAEGFLYPVIDKEKCVNCGLCVRCCPVSGQAFKLNTQKPRCFAVQSSDEIMKHSSSGGMFSVLANYVFDMGGYVCGAGFDKSWHVEHKVISNKSKLRELQTSKYVQSDTKLVYTEIAELLTHKKLVLFSGTPCQVAGLYAFLKKDYDNLLTVEIFCHGAPSPGVFEKYLNKLNLKNIKEINFRDKNTAGGWSDFALSIKNKTKDIHEGVSDNIYTAGFLKNLYLRKSCYQCPFTKVPRTGDFSLGDFWGYKGKQDKNEIRKGVSAVLLNTAKAEKYFDQVRSKLSFVKSAKVSDMIKGNPILEKPVPENRRRADFFKEFKNTSDVISTIEKYTGNKDVGILNYSSFSIDNFGACLVGYAMEKAVAKLGYIPQTISFVPKSYIFRCSQHNTFTDFRQKFLHLTGMCSTKKDLKRHINDAFDKFIIGSDQIVRNANFDFVYYLDWVSGRKTLLSYAASFGVAKLGMDQSEAKYAKKCLDRFDAFSVREFSGADIMKNNFGQANIPVVCDPTLLLDAEDYQQIIDADDLSVPTGEYVAYYLLDENHNALEQLRSKYKLIDAYRDEYGQYRSFGEWLNIIKNAKYVVTDSFHGSVFSIIYKRQFVTLTTKNRGNERLTSLMKILGEDRLITDRNNLTEEHLFTKKIDYTKAMKGILAAREKGYEYLENALKIKPNKKRKMFKIHNAKSYFRLFGFIPLIKTVSKKEDKVQVSLFGIPVLKIKYGKTYLFGLIKIGEYQ